MDKTTPTNKSGALPSLTQILMNILPEINLGDRGKRHDRILANKGSNANRVMKRRKLNKIAAKSRRRNR